MNNSKIDESKFSKIVIFDFDGTIADTLESVIKIVNKNADHFGYRRVTEEDIPYLQGKKPKEILSYLGISIFKLPLWIKRIHSEINKEILNMHPTCEISPVLSELYKDNSTQIGILTSNTKENVNQFLKINNLEFFDFVYSGKSVFGKSHTINKIKKQKQVQRDNVFYVCDEIRDIEAAKKSGIKSIAVTWGYNTKNALARENPDFLVQNIEELRSVLIS